MKQIFKKQQRRFIINRFELNECRLSGVWDNIGSPTCVLLALVCYTEHRHNNSNDRDRERERSKKKTSETINKNWLLVIRCDLLNDIVLMTDRREASALQLNRKNTQAQELVILIAYERLTVQKKKDDIDTHTREKSWRERKKKSIEYKVYERRGAHRKPIRNFLDLIFVKCLCNKLEIIWKANEYRTTEKKERSTQTPNLKRSASRKTCIQDSS